MARYADPDPPRFTYTPVWRDYKFHLTMERGLRPNTLRTYSKTLDRWVQFLGAKDWREATSRDLERFLARPVGAGLPRQGQALSVSVKRHYTVAICGLYRWAHRTGQLDRDPMAAITIGKAPTPVPRDLSLSEIRDLLIWVKGDERATVAVWLGYGCGLRIGEIARLNVEDVQLRGRRPHLWVLNSKGGRSRLVPLPKPVRDALGAYLAQRPGTGPVLQREHPRDGSPMRPGSVGDLIGDAMRAVGIEGGAHRLRHSYATQLLTAGKGRNLFTVSKLLGHSSTTLTETVYGAAYKGELDDVAALLPDPTGGNHA